MGKIQSRLLARLAVAGLLSCFLACGRKPSAVVGGLYAVNDGGGAHRVVKVVAVDKDGVHIRLFKNAWKERPAGYCVRSLAGRSDSLFRRP